MADRGRGKKRRGKTRAATKGPELAADTGAPAPERVRSEAGAGEVDLGETLHAREPELAAAAEQGDSLPSEAPAGDVLLEDWTPMGRCLDWRVGRMAWATSAARLFAEGEIPSLAHDSGTHSRRAAEVLFAWCAARESAGALPDRIRVLELAMGTGLFLRFLLDAFRDRCAASERDWYGRLDVYATDVAADLLAAARDRALFAPHADRVQLGFCDMWTPDRFRPLGAEEVIELEPVHVVFANYALDLLPMDVFRRTRAGAAHGWEAVLARTWLRDVDLLPSCCDLGPEDVLARAQAGEPADVAALAPAWSLLQAEMRAFPVDLSDHPDLADLTRAADHLEETLSQDHALLADGTVVYHSGGALAVTERIAAHLKPDGFALFRDVGLHTAELAAVPRTYQHFGPTVAAALNALEFDQRFGAGDGPSGARSHRPPNDGVGDQIVRLLLRGEGAEVIAAFSEVFDGRHRQEDAAALDRARSEGDPARKIEQYRLSLTREPHNWALMAEAAEAVLAAGLDPRLALVIAGKGLSLNTEYSPDLWAVYADALWALGDGAAARAAYGYALQVHPGHARSHYGHAFIDAQDGRFGSAFRHIGEALAHDPEGVLRSRVLELLDTSLRGQRMARAGWHERMATRTDR